MSEVPWIEQMRRKAMKSGNCAICGGHSDSMEYHHENYDPERGVYVCHDCHFKIHKNWYKLSRAQTTKLVLTRIGVKGQIEAGKGEVDLEAEVDAYVPPVRPKVKPKKIAQLKPAARTEQGAFVSP